MNTLRILSLTDSETDKCMLHESSMNTKLVFSLVRQITVASGISDEIPAKLAYDLQTAQGEFHTSV